MNYIDYSQYAAFKGRCPWFWYEKYVNQVEPRREDRQRGDARAIGSLVHAALEQWVVAGKPDIPKATIDEIGPTPEAMGLASSIMQEYVRRYPGERWAFMRCEAPLEFDIGQPGCLGLAKIDKFFYVPVHTQIETGIAGEEMTLAPGWWIHEYKTKDATSRRDLWNMAWESNMQASFQMLALGAALRGELREVIPQGAEAPDTNAPVRGLLVQVLEKARPYVPKRKCKKCEEQYELSSWLPVGDMHACPMCGNKQKLKPYEPKTDRAVAEFYRLVVTRTPEQLEIALGEILELANEMKGFKVWGENWGAPNREACVHPIYGPCAYFRNHTYNLPTNEDPLMVKVEALKYMGVEAHND